MSDTRARAFDTATLFIALAVAAAGLTLHARLGPADTFWTIDNGGKALVLRAAREGRFTLDYPGHDADPGYACFPQPLTGSERYARMHDGRVVSQYQSPFVWLTLPFAALFGFHGLALLPALGAGACALIAARLARRRTGSAAVGTGAAAVVAVATPLLFYASVFWEHTVAGALAGGALLGLDDRSRMRPWVSGALLGAACLLREELALLLAAAVLVLLARRRSGEGAWWRVALSGSVGIAATAVFHRTVGGSWSGVHVGVNRPVPFAHSIDALRGLGLDTGLTGIPWVVPAVAVALLGASVARSSWRPIVVPVGAVILAVVSIAAWFAYPSGEDQALALVRSNSAVVFLPWIFVAWAWGSRGTGRADAVVALFVLLFLVVVPERTITGVHPGPRLLLLPLTSVAAAVLVEGLRAVSRRGLARLSLIVVLPLLLVAAAWNVRSLHLLREKRVHAGRVADAIRARPERAIATSLFWLPTELSPLWGEKRFHLVGSDADVQGLVNRLSATGERALLVADTPGTIAGEPVASLRSEAFPAFSVDLHVLTLEALPAVGTDDSSVQ